LIAILSSFVIAFIFYPLYKIIFNKTKRPHLSAFIVSLVILLIVIIPVFFVINSASEELLNLYNKINKKMIEDKDLIGVDCNNNSTWCGIITEINTNPKIRFYVSGAVTNLVATFTKNTTSFLFSVPKKIVDIFIMFLLVFFLLQKGKSIWEKMTLLLPLKDSHKATFMKKISNTLNGVVYGYILTSIIEGLIGWFAFFIIGTKGALILGIIVLITGLLPVVGASIVWVPSSLIYLFSGSIYKALIVVLAGAAIAWVDTWVRAKIISDQTSIHPAVVIIGAFGGVISMGVIGLIIGPLVLSLLIAAIEIYQNEKDSFTL
jgi:predicted PurR-regulated permease PerM